MPVDTDTVETTDKRPDNRFKKTYNINNYFLSLYLTLIMTALLERKSKYLTLIMTALPCPTSKATISSKKGDHLKLLVIQIVY